MTSSEEQAVIDAVRRIDELTRESGALEPLLIIADAIDGRLGDAVQRMHQRVMGRSDDDLI